MGPTINLYYVYGYTEDKCFQQCVDPSIKQSFYPLKYNTNSKWTGYLDVKLCKEKEVDKRTEWDSYFLSLAL